MTPPKPSLWPHILTAVLTLLIQLVAAAYVYGQLSATVAGHTEDLKGIHAILSTKLDASTYFREHPRPDGGR